MGLTSRALGRLLRWVWKPALALVVLTTAAVAVLAVVPPLTTAFMIHDRLLHATGTGAPTEAPRKLEYRWKSYREISPELLLAVIAAEDQRFPDHSGFDLKAIERAARHNRDGGSIRGASTLSQQVAKNLFLWPGRSYLRKGLEAALTLLLESCWSKLRILEVYVNVAEFGDRTYGAEAASRRFFSKPARELSASEAAMLAAVLPNPEGLHADRPSAYVRRRQQWILGQMKSLGGTAYLRRISPRL